MYRQGNLLIFSHYKINETAAVCREIISATEEGSCTGIIYALFEKGQGLRAGVTGEYKKNPSEICRVARALLARYEKKPETSYRATCASIAILFICVNLIAMPISTIAANISNRSTESQMNVAMHAQKKVSWLHPSLSCYSTESSIR